MKSDTLLKQDAKDEQRWNRANRRCIQRTERRDELTDVSCSVWSYYQTIIGKIPKGEVGGVQGDIWNQ